VSDGASPGASPCSSHRRRIALWWPLRKQGQAIYALPARPPSRPISGERPLLAARCGLAACPRVWELPGVLLGLPGRLAGNVRSQVHERPAALPERRTAVHALRVQLRPAGGMALRSAVLSTAVTATVSQCKYRPRPAPRSRPRCEAMRRFPPCPQSAGAAPGLLASAGIAHVFAALGLAQHGARRRTGILSFCNLCRAAPPRRADRAQSAISLCVRRPGASDATASCALVAPSRRGLASRCLRRAPWCCLPTPSVRSAMPTVRPRCAATGSLRSRRWSGRCSA
jgi:hypothetical protein